MSKTVDRWAPVPNGTLFCSPACGAGCTRQEYDEAVLAASQLSRRLGESWLPHVWENLGWHYEARRGVCTVSPSGRGRDFLVMLNSTPQVILQGDDPLATVRRAQAEARRIADQLVSDAAFLDD